MTSFGDSRLPEQFWSKATVSDETGCWEWNAAKTEHGYGVFRGSGAHRTAFKALRFDPGPDLECDHLCRVRACVNPDHMRAVTKRENILAGTAPSALNAAKTHCVNGHLFAGENLRLEKGPNGGVRRRCITCAAAYSASATGIRTCGTSSGYRSGCRCDACRVNQRERMRAYRAAKRAASKLPSSECAWMG